MKVALGSDHGGYDLKVKLMEHLKERGIECRLWPMGNLTGEL